MFALKVVFIIYLYVFAQEFDNENFNAEINKIKKKTKKNYQV